MYIFILMLSVISFLPILSLKNNNLSLFVSFFYLLILTLIFGLRYDVGVDYMSYKRYFDYSYDSFNSEIGFSILNYFVAVIGQPFYIVTLVMALLTNSFVFLGVWLSGLRGLYFHLSILLYVANFMMLSLNGMRQALAASIVFAFIAFMSRLKYLKFLLVCFSASMFHLSAIGFYFVIFFRGLLVRKEFIYVLFLFVLASFFSIFIFDFNRVLLFVVEYIPFYSASYAEIISDFSSSSVGLGVLLRFCFSLVLFSIVFYYIESFSDIERIFVSFFLIGLIFNFLSVTNFMWGRVGMYFYIFEVLAIPIIISKIKGFNLKGIGVLAVSAYAFIFIVSLVLNTGENNLIYKSILEQ